MKKSIAFLLFFCYALSFSQDVFLRKIIDIHQNSTDKFLYTLDTPTNNSKLLAEMEVLNYTNDNQKLFSIIYNKAKEIGANSYILKKFQNIDGTNQEVDPTHFKLNLFYTPQADISFNANLVYIIGNGNKTQKIRVDNNNIELKESSYLVKTLQTGQSVTISTKKILGSSLVYSNSNTKLPTYFQISGFKVRDDNYGTGGLIFKSGDIIKLDPSYGQFLTTIYQLQK